MLRRRPFALFWTASTATDFSGSLTTVAFQVLVVSVVGAAAFEIGVLNALRVVPYVFLGLLVGAWMHRWRRRPVLVGAHAARALALAAIPVLSVGGHLDVWPLGGVFCAVGLVALFHDSATQALLPRLVDRRDLLPANARIMQAGALAQSGGPALGGAVVAWLTAPFAVVIDVVVSAGSAVVAACIRVEEPRAPARTSGRHVGHEVLDGLRWTYSHRTVRPLALTMTAFAPFALRELGVGPVGFGLVLACGGAGGVLGALLAPAVGRRLGAGGALLLGRGLAPVAWTGTGPLVIVFSPLRTARHGEGGEVDGG